MTAQATDTSVRASIVVDAPIERAFSVFTKGIETWWPPEHHILEAGLAEMVFEPRQGGHVYDRGVDGSECRWARVRVYEPPERVVISWDINTQWQIRDRPPRRRAKWRCASSPRVLIGRASNSSTASSIATARAGSRSAARWDPPTVGIAACSDSPTPFVQAELRSAPGPVPGDRP
jgi:uncharacterized protein YndB with AHSA1/START domain